MNRPKQRCTRGYKRYKETRGLTEWKMGHIFHSILPWGTMLWMVSKSCPSTSDQVDPKKKE